VLTWKKRCLQILQGSVFTRARWSSETFLYAEMRYSFLVNLMQKLSKSVNICKSCCKKFTAQCRNCFIQEYHSQVTNTVIFINRTCNWLSAREFRNSFQPSGIHSSPESLSVDSFSSSQVPTPHTPGIPATRMPSEIFQLWSFFSIINWVIFSYYYSYSYSYS